MSTVIREEVLRLFERHRATPAAAFEESHFLDYLLASPKGRRTVHNSFAGLRRYNKCIDEMQLHFGICFSLRDFEANYPLDKFVERVKELQASRRSSLASFRNQLRHGFGWGTVFGLNLIATPLVLVATRVSSALAAALLAICLLANAVLFVEFVRWKAYRRQLASRLEASDA